MVFLNITLYTAFTQTKHPNYIVDVARSSSITRYKHLRITVTDMKSYISNTTALFTSFLELVSCGIERNRKDTHIMHYYVNTNSINGFRHHWAEIVIVNTRTAVLYRLLY